MIINKSNQNARIKIQYDVETENGVIKKELPFVIGIIGDFSGNNPWKPQPALEQRTFSTIQHNNFDDVIHDLAPGLSFEIENPSADQKKMLINLEFKKFNDFLPENILEQIPELKELKNIRENLYELLCKSRRSKKTEAELSKYITTNKIIKNIKNLI